MMSDAMEAQRRREECERKARRGEMDPRLEFVFQLLMDGTQLPRHQIMDHIFEGDMVNCVENSDCRNFVFVFVYRSLCSCKDNCNYTTTTRQLILA